MVEISYTSIKNTFFRESEREEKKVAYKLHFIISFGNRPTRITNIIINTVNIARQF